MSDSAELEQWQALYQDAFGLQLDLDGLSAPPAKPGFERLVVVAPGLTVGRAAAACQSAFNVVPYCDLAAEQFVHDRSPNGQPYAVRARPDEAADESLQMVSAQRLRQDNRACMTLLERLLLELKYHRETGDHLDTGNENLLAGSRDSFGGVPSVYWGYAGLFVGCYAPHSAHMALRAREVIV